MPSGGLYATYHLFREPETTIEKSRKSRWLKLSSPLVLSEVRWIFVGRLTNTSCQKCLRIQGCPSSRRWSFTSRAEEITWFYVASLWRHGTSLGGGFIDLFIFTPIPGEMIQFDEHIFKGVETTNQKWWKNSIWTCFSVRYVSWFFSEDLLALISNERSVRQHPKAPDSVGKCCKLSLLGSVVI